MSFEKNNNIVISVVNSGITKKKSFDELNFFEGSFEILFNVDMMKTIDDLISDIGYGGDYYSLSEIFDQNFKKISKIWSDSLKSFYSEYNFEIVDSDSIKDIQDDYFDFMFADESDHYNVKNFTKIFYQNFVNSFFNQDKDADGFSCLCDVDLKFLIKCAKSFCDLEINNDELKKFIKKTNNSSLSSTTIKVSDGVYENEFESVVNVKEYLTFLNKKRKSVLFFDIATGCFYFDSLFYSVEDESNKIIESYEFLVNQYGKYTVYEDLSYPVIKVLSESSKALSWDFFNVDFQHITTNFLFYILSSEQLYEKTVYLKQLNQWIIF